MWRGYRADRIAWELELASSLGFNSVRVFLSRKAYQRSPLEFHRSLEHFLGVCGSCDLSVLPVLFDSCFGYAAAVPEGALQGWIADPGHGNLGSDKWPAYETYVRDVVTAYHGDPRIIGYDIMNEPMEQFTFVDWSLPPDSWGDVDPLGVIGEEYNSFVAYFSALVAALDDSVSVTIGVGHASHLPEVYALEDVLSFHCYTERPKHMLPVLAYVRRLSDRVGKPWLLSEWGGGASWAYSLGMEDVHNDFRQRQIGALQRDYYEEMIPLLEQERLGWYVWQLMVGAFAPDSGLVYRDGTLRPAVRTLKRLLGAASGD
jgi:hypothetical protein